MRTQADRDDDLAIGRELERKDAEINRLQKDKALLVELVMDDTLTPTAKNCVAIVIRDGGLAPTPSVTAWLDKVVDRLNQQSTQEK